MHNHNQTYTRNDVRKAAYEKSPKNISFLTFKMNQEKVNEMFNLNFMNSQNRIRYQHNNYQSPNLIGGLKGNLNKNKYNYNKEENYCQNLDYEEEKKESGKNGITSKMINDSEKIIKWLKFLKIRDAEKLKFFDDAYKDNTKYIKNPDRESIMSEIKKG